MTIKEVSEKYNVSQDTLRYYERMKMIPKVHRTSGGIRDYRAEDMRWVELALCMRSAGLPIEVMIEYLRLFQEGDRHGWSCSTSRWRRSGHRKLSWRTP